MNTTDPRIEQQEFDKFMVNLIHKANEVQKDFNNLSPDNQQRVNSEVWNMCRTMGMANALAFLRQKYGR